MWLRSPAIMARRDLAASTRGVTPYLLRAVVPLLAAATAAYWVWDMVRWRGWMSPSVMAVVGPLAFRATLLVQLLMAAIIAPLRGLSTVALERERGTLPLLALTPLGSTRAVLGKLASSVLFTLAVALSIAPVQMLSVIFGGVSLEDVALGYLMVLELCLLGAALGTLCGLASVRPAVCVAWMAGLTILLYVVLPGQVAARWPGQGGSGLYAALHPLSLVSAVVDLSVGVGGNLAAYFLSRTRWALRVGLPLQIVAFTVAALVLARSERVSGQGVRAKVTKWTRERRDLGVAGCLAIAFGVPIILTLAIEAIAGVGDLGYVWFRIESMFIYLGAAFLAVMPIARERQRGTMPLLLATPRPSYRYFLSQARDALLFVAIAAMLQFLHLVVYARLDPTVVGDAMLPWSLPLRVALTAMPLLAAALIASSVARSAFAALAMTAFSMTGWSVSLVAWHLVTAERSRWGYVSDELAGMLLYGGAADKVLCLLFAPLADPAPNLPLLAATGLGLLAIGTITFAPLQRRLPTR